LYNVLARWLMPLDNYRAYITPDLEPFHADGEIAVLGLNTARSLTFKNGRINREQVARGCGLLGPLDREVVRVVVTHHPFALPDETVHDLVGRARMAIDAFSKCRVDIILSGHLHASHTELSAEQYKHEGHSALLVQAGTATSSRTRGEENSFNILRIDNPAVGIDRLTWDEARNGFVVAKTDNFTLTGDGWRRAETSAAA
jgi:predicted phosphodiesterase